MSLQEKLQSFIKEWNNIFFPDGKYQSSPLTISVTFHLPNGKDVSFQAEATPRTTINDLARAYAKNGVQMEQVAAKPKEEKELDIEVKTGATESPMVEIEKKIEDKVLDIKHVAYRNNEYIVQHYIVSTTERHKIINAMSKADIGVNTPTGRGVLKKYREGDVIIPGEEE